jgi:predicted MFS family arabinose efflux permease
VTLLAGPSITTSAVQHLGRYWDGVMEGLRFLRRDRVLLALACGLFITNFLGNPFYSIVLPVYAKDDLHSSRALGLMLSAAGIGALLGTLAFGWRMYRWSRRKVWLIAFLTAPLSYWVLLPKPALPIILAVIVACEFVGGPSNPLGVTVRHERIPPELRGRVFSTFSSIAMASTPLGIALAGFAIERAGFTPTVLAFALVYQAVAIGMLFVPAFAELDRLRPAPKALVHE